MVVDFRAKFQSENKKKNWERIVQYSWRVWNALRFVICEQINNFIALFHLCPLVKEVVHLSLCKEFDGNRWTAAHIKATGKWEHFHWNRRKKSYQIDNINYLEDSSFLCSSHSVALHSKSEPIRDALLFVSVTNQLSVLHKRPSKQQHKSAHETICQTRSTYTAPTRKYIPESLLCTRYFSEHRHQTTESINSATSNYLRHT